MHALVDDIQRVLSLAGLLHIEYQYYITVDRRVADIQDLVSTKPGF